MKIFDINNSQSFGQKVPTVPLLKSGLNIHNYDEGAALYKSIKGNKFPGHVGYHKQAAKLAKEISEKNKNIKNILGKLKEISTKDDQNRAIKNISQKYGEFLDVTV